MANYCVKASGSNTAPYDTWAKAATSLATVTALAVAGDKIFMDSGMTQAVAGTTWTVANYVELYSTSDTTNVPAQTYVKGATLDASATSGADLVATAGCWYGFIFKSGTGTAVCDISVGSVSGAYAAFESCDFYTGGTSTSTRINMGNASFSTGKTKVRTRNCGFYWNHTGHGLAIQGDYHDEGSDFCAGATVPTTLFRVAVGNISIHGADFSDISGTLVSGTQGFVLNMNLYGCKMNASVTRWGSHTTPGGDLYTWDCSDGDTHYLLTHDTFNGTTTVATTPVMSNSDAAKYDGTNPWVMVVTGNAQTTFGTPYQSPWLDAYHDGGSAITPYFEILRNDDVGAFTNRQVWAEFLAKVTASSTRLTFYSDRDTPLSAAAANQTDGVGLASWTGEGVSAKSLKVDSGSSMTPAELGFIRGRVCLGDNITVYVNPKILGR